MLSVRQISVNIGGKLILSDISFDLPKGEILTIIGSSGCGKSTFLNVLSGINKEYEGEVIFNDENIQQNSIIRGYIPQNLGLLDWKTVKENIFLAKTINSKIEIDPKEAEDIIEKLELQELLHRFPTELSGGQRQRVALARLFLSRPELILMDEPFTALDTFTAEISRKLFLSLWKKRKITTVFTTHNLQEAVFLGKKILIMGKSPANILEIVENPYFDNNSSDKKKYQFAFELKKKLEELRNEGRF